MQRLATILNVLFRLAEVSALIALTWLAISANRAIHEATASMVAIQHVAEALPFQVLSEAHGQLSGARTDITKQLAETNKILDKHLAIATGSLYRQIEQARIDLTGQTGQIAGSTSRLLDYAREGPLEGANTLIANPDIPKLLRDTRTTMAFAGVATRHIDTLTNTLAETAPKVSASAISVSESSAGIAADAHRLTQDWTAPRPLWRRILSFVVDAGKIGSAFR